MASNIQLHDLIEALAGAVIEAQDSIEQHRKAGRYAGGAGGGSLRPAV
jgi:hypothetical protein